MYFALSLRCKVMSRRMISDFFTAKPAGSATNLGAGPSIPPQVLEDPPRSQRGRKRDVNARHEQPSHARGRADGCGRGVARMIDAIGQDHSSERGRARGRGRGRSRARAPPIVLDPEPSDAPRARAPPIDIDAEPSNASLASLAFPRSWGGTGPCRSEEPEYAHAQQAATATADRQAAAPQAIEALEAPTADRQAATPQSIEAFPYELQMSQGDGAVDLDSTEATRDTPTTSPASSAMGAPRPSDDSESQVVPLDLPPPDQADADTSLKTAFEWNRHCFDVLSELDIAEGRDEHDSLSRFVTAFSGSTWSSACSGIDSPCAALTDLRAGALQYLDVDTNVDLPRCLHAIEWDKQCLKELTLIHEHHAREAASTSRGQPLSTCLFGDISSFFDSHVQELLPELQRRPEIALDALTPIVKAGKAMKREAWCHYHQKMCRITCGDRHVAGTPCTAFSAQGARRQQYDKTIIHFCAWAGLRILLQEPLVVFENVKGLEQLVLMLLGHIYDVKDMSFMSPHEQAFPIVRPREYFVLRHKVKTLHLISPLARFAVRFHRVTQAHWEEFYFLHKLDAGAGVVPHELNQDLQWAQSRRTCVNKGNSNVSYDYDAVYREDNDNHSLFLKGLTVMETEHLNGYAAKWDDEAHVFQLNQNPQERCLSLFVLCCSLERCLSLFVL